MQRINYFPNPNFIPTGAHSSANGKDISKYFVDHTFANTSGYDIDLPFQDYDAGVEYVCTASVKADSSNGRKLAVWGTINTFVAASVGVGVKTIRFIAMEHTRLAVPSGITIDGLCVERADTYDTAIGGGSSLLLRRHDAARIGASVGRVMSDDGHEPDKQSKRPRHAEAGRVHADYDHREDSGYPILVHGLARRVGRLHHDRQLSRHLQQEPTHRMVPHVHEPESDEHEIQGRVRQSDRQGVEHGHVRAGRIPGEQGIARRSLLFRRGYDATRLTLTGVMA